MIKKTTLALCVLALAFVSCQNNEGTNSVTSSDALADTPTIIDMHTSQIALDWHGTYEGTLPCADCPGIKTTIELKNDNTFTQHLEYLDRDADFTETGKIEWHQNSNTITLISEDGGKQLFKVKEGSLVMLNADGEENNGELAEHYVLNKED
jgi:uncharacterized lipoprotein NlpE involved in copper resistance